MHYQCYTKEVIQTTKIKTMCSEGSEKITKGGFVINLNEIKYIVTLY